MGSMPMIIPISALRQDAAGVIKRAAAAHKPVFVTQRGRATAVLVDAESYERTHHELELLHRLARGEAEIQAGVGYRLPDVLAQADAILAESDGAGTD
jgi:prevent-host-death family protein